MIEIRGNLWNFFDDEHILAITTNGSIKKNGEGVMGRGCALEATRQIPGIAKVLGDRLKFYGNTVFELNSMPTVISFPVKHRWYEKADLNLIRDSAEALHEFMICEGTDRTIMLPRPGCGNGKLDWAEVKPILRFLSDRVWIISF